MTLKKKAFEEVIDKGGKVKADISPKEVEWTNFTLRIKKSMLEEIDLAVDQRAGITKTGWILEKIHEGLKKELQDA